MPVIPNESSDQSAELLTLRKVRDELLTKTHTQKSRIEALESESLQLTEQADKAVAIMRAAVIDLPLKRFADTVSSVPELWLAEIRKDYDFEPNGDGSLALHKKTGEAVKDDDGKPIAFTHNALYTLLIGKRGAEKTARNMVYKTIMFYSGAYGGAGRTEKIASALSNPKKDASVSFGLR